VAAEVTDAGGCTVQCEKPLDIAASLPPQYSSCAATMAHPKFAARRGEDATTPAFTFLDLNHTGTWGNVVRASHALHPRRQERVPDLDSMADFSTCAVVGSSNLLVGKGASALRAWPALTQLPPQLGFISLSYITPIGFGAPPPRKQTQGSSRIGS
jgi:hypothetical protein